MHHQSAGTHVLSSVARHAMLVHRSIPRFTPSLTRSVSSFWSSKTIRDTFIEYFKSEGHTFVRSSSVVPREDASLILVNAGMNQFKPIFLEQVSGDHAFAHLRRAVNSQKCIRCGGKHNDLASVGRDLRHHTFFEMLGNWSFGDYGKEEAIRLSWHLLTSVFHLDPSRLVITYFAGDPALNLEADAETEHIWRSIIGSSISSRTGAGAGDHPSSAHNSSIHQPQMIGLGSEDNFWEMGFTGPCGPCTEIHYLIDADARRQAGRHAPLDIMSGTTEIWNLVFMQFNRTSTGSLQPLARRHVDTGMGLERITSILQTEKQTSNYDTDLFVPLFREIQRHTNQRPYAGSLDDPLDVAYRMIADHARMYTVAIADGVLPDKQDACHKVRSVIRSAHWQLVDAFGVHQPIDLLTSLADVVSESLGQAYPEIASSVSRVKESVAAEVRMFHEHLRKTRKIFKKIAKDKKAAGDTRITGEEAFSLYKKFGCPVQLLQQLGHRFAMEIDLDRFDRIMREEHERSIHSLRQRTGEREAGREGSGLSTSTSE